nr:transposase, mutator type [Tanacetum cinerariifolium]
MPPPHSKNSLRCKECFILLRCEEDENIIGEDEAYIEEGEIPWLERKDCGEDIGCGSSKGKETKVEANGNVTEYYDPFEDLDDILGQYSNEEHFEMNNDSDGFVDEQSMIEDVPEDIHPFKNDLERNDTLVRIGDIERRKILRELRKQGKSIDRGIFDFFVSQRFDNRELVKDRIKKYSVESRRKLSITKNDIERVRDICVGTMPIYSSFDLDLDFSQASNDGPIIKERQENGNPSGNLLTCGKVAGHNQKGYKAKGKMNQILNHQQGPSEEFMYVWGAFKKGFKASGRENHRLDGRLMKGPYPETKSSWCWFLKLLGLDLDSAKNSNFTFISDRRKWHASEQSTTLIPHVHKPQVDMPRKERRNGAFESIKDDKLNRKEKTVTCSQCGNLGDNKRGCTSQGGSSLFSMACATLEEVAALKEPFKLEKMPSYSSLSKKEFDRAGDDLANASYAFLAEVTTGPYAHLEVLPLKKLKLLRAKPISSKSKPSSLQAYDQAL